MSSRPASPPPIVRWPFYAGVGVLLVLAGSILLYADRPFSAPVMVATLVSACLGIALGILPEMLDAERRIRVAEAGARETADAQLRRLAQVADQLTHVVSRSQSTEEQAGRALGTMEEAAERMVNQAEELSAALTRAGEREQGAQAEEIQRLTDERDQKLTALEIRLNATTVALTETQAAIKKAVASNARSLDSLGARLEQIAEELRVAIASRSRDPEPDAAAELPSIPHEHAIPENHGRAFEAEHPTADVAAPSAEVPPVDRPAEPIVTAERVGTDGSATSVPTSEPERVPQVEAAPVPAAADETTAVAPRPRKVRAHRPIEKPGDEPAPISEAAPEPEPAPARPTAPLELALEGMPEPRPVMRLNRREPAGSTSLVATAYIGIGNKLYLRGDGPGLSWERGVPMQFLAIGKWGWTTTEATAPVTCRLYRNDDTPMLEENVVIDPGTKAEITPKF